MTSNHGERDSLFASRKIHFIGIGGISMSSLAMIAKHEGAAVTGSDSSRSRMTARLEAAGIPVHYAHRAENIPPDCTTVVYTAAVHDDNPELAAARARGIECFSRAEFLGQLMLPYRRRIGIAGTHGKSTTTSMVSMAALRSGIDPTIVSGAELEEIGGAYCTGGKDMFIFEACEYTDSFLCFFPTTAVVLNVELEHVDYFRDLEQMTESFRKYIAGAKCAVVCADSEAALAAADEYTGRLVTYSTSLPESPDRRAEVHYFCDNISYSGGDTSFALKRYIPATDTEELICAASLQLPGLHNISDAVAAAAACFENGISAEAIKEGLQAFRGAKRRFEYRGETATGVSVYDDYAHHPTEIRATIDAARTLGRKIRCVFQPHTYSRTAAFFDQLSEAFEGVDRLIFTDIYSAGREQNESGISAEALAAAVPGSLYIPKGDGFRGIAELLLREAEAGDMILVMGAGDIVGLSDLLLENGK